MTLCPLVPHNNPRNIHPPPKKKGVCMLCLIHVNIFVKKNV